MLPTSQKASLKNYLDSQKSNPQQKPNPQVPQLSDTTPKKTLGTREFRTFKLSPPAPSQANTQPRTKLTLNFTKRKIIDLTLSDEEDITTVPYKKSRSSSQSTDPTTEALRKTDEAIHPVVAETAITSHETVSAPKKIYFAAKSTKVKGKKPEFRFPSSQDTSHSKPSSAVSAVQIGPAQPSPAICRENFLKNLMILSGVTIVNTIDDSSPPLNFKFIKENVIGKDVEQATDEFMSGCTCRKDNGRQIGCEYLSCECLQDSITAEDGKKKFPYSAASKDPGCLRQFYLQGGYHIFECNRMCNCDSNCKNRVVQHGRKVPLEIFKTTNRGWGLRCKVDLKTGQFIDTYRGEIITNEEAERRGVKRHKDDQENYFFNLDRWEPESKGYVCDGKFVGGPTRFMNHSCDSNCRQMTVSYNHCDVNIYDLAFFAMEPIPAGTELTFDYAAAVEKEVDDDGNSVEGSRVITEKKAEELEKKKGYRPSRCLCGAWNCRGYFFT